MTTQPVCLLVDDEPDILIMLERTLKKDFRIECLKARTVNEALELIATTEFSLCLTDMRLPNQINCGVQPHGGMRVIAEIHKKNPTIPIIVMTAHADSESTTQSLKVGAFDYISKPIAIVKLIHVIKNALEATEYTLAINTKKREYVTKHLIGDSKQMRELRSKLETIAYAQVPVLIKGESGTGKEVVARAIHRLSSRADKPFIAVNCGAISSELMESEFFGHKKGSFTGAMQNKNGFFQAAEGGFLFLDEIGDLPLPMQVKLLRAIQEKQIRPVGSNQEIPADVRILSATHRDLGELVKTGGFREDLLYRINVIELYIPPLRERAEDISLLSQVILKRVSATLGINPALYLHSEAIKVLQRYPFEGNIRELQNILERAATVCQSSEILPQDLQLPTSTHPNNAVAQKLRSVAPISAIAKEFLDIDAMVTGELSDFDVTSTDESLTFDTVTMGELPDFDVTMMGELSAFMDELTFISCKNLRRWNYTSFLAEMEKAKIAYALKRADFNISLAAKSLKVTRATLRYRIARYGLNFNDIKE
ncbi:MAG: sigma-54 dependent transcriptional regulator [Thiotrichaceae bacterium]